MATRGRGPEAGVRIGAWRFDVVPQGQQRIGWLAGPIHDVLCHHQRGTKPCRKMLLGTTANCDPCNNGVPHKWFGYVPVKTEHGRPLVIGIHESVYPLVDKIALGSRIRWGRDSGVNQGVWVQPITGGDSWRHYWPDEKPHHDLTSWLLVLWKMPDLRGALAERWANPVVPRGQEEPLPAVAEGLPYVAAGRDPATVNDAYAEVFGGRLAATQPNGNGKHKGKRH